MIMLKLRKLLPISIILFNGAACMLRASGDTKITIKDGGSLLLWAQGLDAGANWKVSSGEVKNVNAAGVVSGVKATSAGADVCKGDSMCGINPAKSWSIRITYGPGYVVVGSLSGKQGVHLTNHKIPFNTWKATANADEREFGHGDGYHIKAISVNGGPNLCGGQGCEVDLTYTTP